MINWTASQRERQAAVLAGTSVVVNVRKGTDDALVAWAKAEGHFVYIGRQVRGGWKQSDWANPFKLGKHGSRDEIIAAYRDHLDHSPWARTATAGIARQGTLVRVPSTALP